MEPYEVVLVVPDYEVELVGIRTWRGNRWFCVARRGDEILWYTKQYKDKTQAGRVGDELATYLGVVFDCDC